MTEARTNPDEITHSQYRAACLGIERCGKALAGLHDIDEAITHWLPELTRHTAVVFSYVGDNATMRNVPQYVQTVADMEMAKDVSRGTLRPPPQQ